MMPLYDMLAKAQDGRAMEELGRQYGLSAGQTQAALEALLPAFSQGLKRNAADPYGVGSFLSALSSGRHADYYANPQSAFSASGTQEGNGILGHLFGSPEVSRAVAAHAAQTTGITQQILQQMLPALASMIMGGLFNQASGGQASGGQVSGGQSSGAPANPLQEIMERMMRQGGAMQAPQPKSSQAGASGSDNPLQDMLEGMFGGGAGANAARQPAGDNPLGRIFEEMISAGRPGEQAAAAPAQDGDQRNPYDDLFGQMFETGHRTSEEYHKSVKSVFDQFLEGMDRQRR